MTEDVRRAAVLIRGVRNLTLRRLLLLMARYCTGHVDSPLIDLHGKYEHRPNQEVLTELKDVVGLFMERERMSRRTAYDYAKTVEKIQFLAPQSGCNDQ